MEALIRCPKCQGSLVKITKVEKRNVRCIYHCKCGCDFRAIIGHGPHMSAIKYEVLGPEPEAPKQESSKKWEW